jgi:methylated-DNA-protein-cysteine methyltransferase-like protein|tara:strand:- start:269 stop:607 length:339 start_codon:yes stop_codon:yes gene_type:complete
MSNKNKSDFFENVYTVVKKIPFGKVTSYGAIAKYLGSSKSARVVGWAMNASHLNKDIPAHRVVNRVGLLTGKKHFFGINLMKQLLESEGLIIENDQIQDFKYFFWDPNKELE